MKRRLRVCALYPDVMNIYADRGNLLMLRRRCQWRGIDFEMTALGVGEKLEADDHDLIYLGGGQDRDQAICAKDLVDVKGAAVREAAERGAVVLGVCGGYQLLGRSCELGSGETLPGVGLLDIVTVRATGRRLIGNIAIEVDIEGAARQAGGAAVGGAAEARAAIEGGRPRAPSQKTGGELAPTPQERAGGEFVVDGERVPKILAGFENHGGRTKLQAGQGALGRVLKGFGNDGASGLEGARRGNVIGTYLHGPLLPKNAWLADWAIARAMGMDVGELGPLDDELEEEAHRCAVHAVGL